MSALLGRTLGKNEIVREASAQKIRDLIQELAALPENVCTIVMPSALKLGQMMPQEPGLEAITDAQKRARENGWRLVARCIQSTGRQLVRPSNAQQMWQALARIDTTQKPKMVMMSRPLQDTETGVDICESLRNEPRALCIIMHAQSPESMLHRREDMVSQLGEPGRIGLLNLHECNGAQEALKQLRALAAREHAMA